MIAQVQKAGVGRHAASFGGEEPEKLKMLAKVLTAIVSAYM